MHGNWLNDEATLLMMSRHAKNRYLPEIRRSVVSERDEVRQRWSSDRTYSRTAANATSAQSFCNRSSTSTCKHALNSMYWFDEEFNVRAAPYKKQAGQTYWQNVEMGRRIADINNKTFRYTLKRRKVYTAKRLVVTGVGGRVWTSNRNKWCVINNSTQPYPTRRQLPQQT